MIDTNFDDIFGKTDETFSFNGTSSLSQVDPKDAEIEMLKAEIERLKSEIELMQTEVCAWHIFILLLSAILLVTPPLRMEAR